MRHVLATLLLITVCVNSGRAEPPAAPNNGHELRLASFNCWQLPLVSKNKDERFKRLPDALRSLKLDVICLQEMWVPADQKRLATALVKTHPHVAHAGGGLMVLSRYPIVSERFVRFPDDPGLSLAERLGRKGILDVCLKTPAGPLRFVSTHMALTRGEDSPRTKQIAFLLAHIKPYARQALFVVGDFNTGALGANGLDDQYKRLLEAHLSDASPPRRSRVGWLHPPVTRPPWPRTQQNHVGWDPDHIFFRSHPELRVIKKSFELHFAGSDKPLSDHNLLAATFTLKPIRPSAVPPPPPKAPTEGQGR